jgi:hypothetical protein
MNWEMFAIWFAAAYVVGGLIQALKKDWLPKAPSWVWKITTPIVAAGIALLRYWSDGAWLIAFNAVAIYVTTFLFFDVILKRVTTKVEKDGEGEGA